MIHPAAFLSAAMFATGLAAADRPLPPLKDGIVVSGPGSFHQDSALILEGRVTLRNLTLRLNAPISVAEGATLVLENVQILVSDPPGTPNGTSNLRCLGPAHIIIRDSALAPVAGAHPIWELQGSVAVDDFQTVNSEFHFNHVQAHLIKLKIFELEISRESRVIAEQLRLVFLSTHAAENDKLQFENVPADKPFTRNMPLGSGAMADFKDTQVQIFLLYMHGAAEASLSHMDRVQLAIFPDCRGTIELGHGRMGTALKPAVFPGVESSNCPFRISLQDVNVDTWDVYAGGHADLTFQKSRIDELNVSGDAKIHIQNSEIYADWMAVWDNARITVEYSTVGALRLASSRPDLATSQIRLSGKSHSIFKQVRFDCGVVAKDDAHVEILEPRVPPKYINKSGNAVVESRNSP